MQVELRQAMATDVTLLQTWLDEPAAGVLEYAHAEEMLSYYLRSENGSRPANAYVIVAGGANVGFVTVNLEFMSESEPWIDIEHIMVITLEQQKGYGSATVARLIGAAGWPRTLPVRVACRLDNYASIACFKSAGFVEVARTQCKDVTHGACGKRIDFQSWRPPRLQPYWFATARNDPPPEGVRRVAHI